MLYAMLNCVYTWKTEFSKCLVLIPLMDITQLQCVQNGLASVVTRSLHLTRSLTLLFDIVSNWRYVLLFTRHFHL